MNILFYTPINFRCRDIESLAGKFIQGGHQVFLLSQCAEGTLHDAMRSLGVKTSVMKTTDKSVWSTFNKVNEVVKFCRQHKIDVCFSHLEPTNFISVIAQYFVSTRFIIYRHHINAAHLSGFDRSFAYRATYRLAKTIVCVSEQAKDYMIQTEHVRASRIHHINLGYDFSRYPLPGQQAVAATRKNFPDGIVLIVAGRLTSYKRPSLCLDLVKRALQENIKVSLVFLGVGDEESQLRAQAEKDGIKDRVLFKGYTHSILDYMAAADLLIHPSISESSCVVIKEASLVGLPVVVCKGVGDFDDYMVNNKNGVVVSPDNFVNETLPVLREYQSNPERFRQLGINLRADIVSRFHIDNVIGEYNKLLGV